MQNALPSERAAVIGSIDPDVNTAAAYTVALYVDASKFASIMGIVQCGTLGSSATVDFALVQATDTSGTSSKAISGKSITQLTQAGTDASDKQAIINLRADELDTDNGFTFVSMTMTVGTATSDASAILLGFDPSYAPASDNDIAAVVEIIG